MEKIKISKFNGIVNPKEKLDALAQKINELISNSNKTKTYIAYITQSSTSAPVAYVLKNDFSGTVTWSRSDAGTYTGTPSFDDWSLNTTVARVSVASITTDGVGPVYSYANTGTSTVSNGVCYLTTINAFTNLVSDDILTAGSFIEIITKTDE